MYTPTPTPTLTRALSPVQVLHQALHQTKGVTKPDGGRAYVKPGANP